MGDGLCELLVDDRCELLQHVSSDAQDLFSILETWEECMNGGVPPGGGAVAAAATPTASSTSAFSPSSMTPADGSAAAGGDAGPATTTTPTGNGRRRSSFIDEASNKSGGGAPVQKKQKGTASDGAAGADDDGAVKMSHIAVERNRRKQMNEHLAVLRSLMPCFYVKRGDQASIIGGVVDYIKELQQVLRSLEAKKNRKAYADHPPVLSPRPGVAAAAASPRPLIRSTPPLSPRVAVPISPQTPTRPGSPYYVPCRPPAHPAAAAAYVMASSSPAMTPTTSSSSSYHSSSHDQQHHHSPTLDSIVTELAAHAAAARPAVALPDVKVEFAGPNLVLKTVSRRAPGQVLKIIAALESLSLEILHVSVSTVEDTMVHSFTIKIGIECELSAEELVQEIQRTFL